MNIATLDRANSAFEMTCLIPNAFALRALWVALHDEAISLPATIWWTAYLAWETFYLWSLDQPISSGANFVMMLMYATMVYILVSRRRGTTPSRIPPK